MSQLQRLKIQPKFPPISRKQLAAGASVLMMAAVLMISQNSAYTPQQRIDIALDVNGPIGRLAADTWEPAPINTPQWQTIIKEGDNLSALFQQAGLSTHDLLNVLDADLSVLALDTLRPGHELKLWKTDDGHLAKLELVFNAAHQVIFERASSGEFSYREVKREGNWQPQIISGEISNSFYNAARASGLSASDAVFIGTLFRDKIDFTRSIRKGDTFQVLRKNQYIDGAATGEHKIMAVRFQRGNTRFEVFRNNDGHFYDENANGLSQGFLERPYRGKFRISSRFDPKRKHPVTGLIRPHNGVDFATPVGTPVLAPADGVVRTVTNHRFAGRYVVIQHGDRYRTRFLHLSRALVSPGQTVRQGQVIARSGATGRITGPHLHYELHVNGRPVDPLKVHLPRSEKLAKSQQPQYFKLVKQRQLMLDLS
ncbi:peptidoglycan DD-metalloendopeptidase family protein [Paraferrimonas haliotis]|uniref:Subfamily M23B unassigned peptidase n=1 Tax=Paraferrimonas haliotis TaxID=2013866 RepID=A0AA37TS03_9GAMM|nr:peptidoglycan DD-metalloendopeptidase family protein [Paraferrimonas haliotis]GLS83461.1 subfamily M23B unassigned peptidase [Paraferrimonas haliotis]